MPGILFTDIGQRENLLPLTYLRPVSELRVGILTLREKWEALLGKQADGWHTATYLQNKFPAQYSDTTLFINAGILPTQELFAGENLLACHINSAHRQQLQEKNISLEKADLPKVITKYTYQYIQYPWHIFQYNAQAIVADYTLLTKGRKSAPIPDTCMHSGKDIFIEAGAKLTHAIINATEGPVYIGKDAEIMEGCLIRGPFALCENAVLKMGAKIYGASTIGPGCKVGGEVSNTVFFANANKAHDGFLGNSVIAEWCNLGADTNTSNLKNNYSKISVWNYMQENYINTGLQFCGLTLGDHSRCSINSMFNTGTVAGICANVFGNGFPSKHIPSFGWGCIESTTSFELEKAYEAINNMMKRRNTQLTEEDKNILAHIFNETAKYRN